MTLKFLNIFPLLKRYEVQPKKSLGQNFLVEPSGLQKVIDAAGLEAHDHVLEIGAGVGGLTYLLAQLAEQVTAVELDGRMIPALREALRGFDNVKIVQGDMLELAPDALMGAAPYLVVANIPYYISSALIRHLLEAVNKPQKMVLTIQKEVAQRVCARDGKMSLLALSVWVYGKPELAAHISAGNFFPAPTVDSSVLTIALYPQPLIAAEDLDLFFSLAHAGFGQKRKTLRNSLSAGLKVEASCAEALLTAAGIDPGRRAETLNLEEWQRLTSLWKAERIR